MCSTTAILNHLDFLYNIATSSKADWREHIKKASDEQVTLLIECLGNVSRFLDHIPQKEEDLINNIVHAYVHSNNRDILLEHWEFVRSITARILRVVYRAELWCVMLNHG